MNQIVNKEEIRVDTQHASDSVPSIAMKWNWGAFLLSPIWAIRFEAWHFIFIIIPIVVLRVLLRLNDEVLHGETIDFALEGIFLLVSLLQGKFGGRIAWQNKDWVDEHHYAEEMENWNGAGIALLIFFVIFLVIRFVIA